jgi:hypothetical protein
MVCRLGQMQHLEQLPDYVTSSSTKLKIWEPVRNQRTTVRGRLCAEVAEAR